MILLKAQLITLVVSSRQTLKNKQNLKQCDFRLM